MTDPASSFTPESSRTPDPAHSRVVRVFISSTFRDFGVERDLLMKRVFPELRRRARSRFVEVIGVDLRWGITEEESQKGDTLPICLREIERSRPYFIGLLGERYGWTPSANQYPELLVAQQPWLAQHAGGTSVTELEVLHGVLNNPEMAGRAFFYFRDAKWSESKGGDFRSEGDAERAKLSRLKERIRGSAFETVEYATPEEVADRITEDLWALINGQYPEDTVPDELERERRSHEAYAAERRRLYIGQEETVLSLLARLEDASDESGDGVSRDEASQTRVTLVTGESGTGKSALIANVLARYRELHPNDVVIEHYIGSTSDASDPMKLMRRVAEEIKRLTNASTEIETEEDKLIEQFATWLADASFWAKKRGVRVVLALDALDKLSGHARLNWLPRFVAPQLRIVMSTLGGESRDVLAQREVKEVAAGRFTEAIARNYIVETLAHRGRKLPAREVERIVAHSKSTLPLFLKMLVEELSVFGSHEQLPKRITECLAAEEPDDLFEVILARLEVDLGRDAVQKPLEAIWASPMGMSDDEILAFTGLAPLALARLKLALGDVLYESGGFVRLAHAYAEKGVKDRYLPTEELSESLSHALGLWWQGQEPTPRSALLINQHLFYARAWEELQRCLVTPRTGMPMLEWVDAELLFRSWNAAFTANTETNAGQWIARAFASNWEEWQQTTSARDDQGLGILRGLSSLLLLAGFSGSFACIVADERYSRAHAIAQRLGTPESRRDVIVSLDMVAGIEEARGNLDGALVKYREALEIARRLAEELGTPESRRDLSVTLRRVAGVEETRGDFAGALAGYEESLGIMKELAEELDTAENRRGVSVSLNAVGGIDQALGDFDAALAKYQESLAISRRLADELETPACHRDVSVTLIKLAGIEHARGEYDGALAKYEWSLEIGRLLAVYLDTPGSHCDVSQSLEHVADIKEARGDFGGALAKYEESLEIRKRLAAYLDTPASRRNLSVSLIKVARIEQARGDLDAALAKYEESLVITRRLAEELGIPESRRDVSVSLAMVAGIEEARGNLDAALVKYQESLEIQRLLAEQLGTPVSHRDVSLSLDKVAGIEEVRGDFDGALAKYEESLEISRRLEKELDTPENFRAVSASLGRVAGIELARGDLDGALAKYAESLDMCRRLAAYLDTPESRSDVSGTLEGVARIKAARRDYGGALSLYEECLEIRKRVAEESDTPQSRREVSVSLEKVAGMEEACGDLDAALTKYEESLEIRRRLVEEHSTPQSRRDVSVSLIKVASIEQARGNFDAALAKYEESLEMSRRLAEELGTPESHRDMMVGLIKVAGIEHARGELDAAREKYKASLEIARHLAEKLATSQSHHDLRLSLDRLTGIEKARGDHDAVLAIYEESLGIERRLAEEGGTPQSRQALSVRLNMVAGIEEALGDLDSALTKYEESLENWRELIRQFEPVSVEWVRAVIWCLTKCRDLCIVAGQFERALAFANERWELALSETENINSPRAFELRLSALIPMMRCEIELAMQSDAEVSREMVQGMVNWIVAAFEDPGFDNSEECINSTTLFCCAEGLELCARVDEMLGASKAADALKLRGIGLRTRAEALKAAEGPTSFESTFE